MIDTLNVYKEGSPKSILDGVMSSISDFAGDAVQFDDLTMLCLELK